MFSFASLLVPASNQTWFSIYVRKGRSTIGWVPKMPQKEMSYEDIYATGGRNLQKSSQPLFAAIPVPQGRS
jgi:hypothetical protein